MPGSSSRSSLAHLRNRLSDCSDLQSLYGVVVLLAISRRLRSSLVSRSLGCVSKQKLIAELTGKDPDAFICMAVSLRWSEPIDLLYAFEEMFIRASCARRFAGCRDFLDELFWVSSIVDSHKILDKTLSARFLPAYSKKQLISGVFAGAHEDTLAVLEYFACYMQKKRAFRECVFFAEKIVADELGAQIADVITGRPLSREQRDELVDVLSRRFKRRIILREVINKKVFGGVRVQVNHSVIDDTVAVHLNNLALSFGALETFS